MRVLPYWYRLVLVGILTDREHWAARAGDLGRHLPYGRVRSAYLGKIAHAKVGIVPTNLADWLKRAPTASDRVQLSKTLGRLEDLGLVQRIYIGGSSRLSHVKLTPEGEELAWELATAPGPVCPECQRAAAHR